MALQRKIRDTQTEIEFLEQLLRDSKEDLEYCKSMISEKHAGLGHLYRQIDDLTNDAAAVVVASEGTK